jgi:hypothetical protein
MGLVHIVTYGTVRPSFGYAPCRPYLMDVLRHLFGKHL